jgi:hypothetical protein
MAYEDCAPFEVGIQKIQHKLASRGKKWPMLLSKPCKLLQPDQKCLRNGTYCDPYCRGLRYFDPDGTDEEEDPRVQGKTELVWFEKMQNL